MQIAAKRRYNVNVGYNCIVNIDTVKCNVHVGVEMEPCKSQGCDPDCKGKIRRQKSKCLSIIKFTTCLFYISD